MSVEARSLSSPSSLSRAETVPVSRQPWSHAKAVLLGSLVVGTLDITDAFVFWFLRADVSPMRILHSVAAGLLGGEAAKAGGMPTALLGLFLHFSIATSVVLVYNLASRRLPVLTRHPIVCGLVYGLGVYAVMYYVVVPLSAAGRGLPSLAPSVVLANNLLIHLLGVGVPAAWFASRAAGSPAAPTR